MQSLKQILFEAILNEFKWEKNAWTNLQPYLKNLNLDKQIQQLVKNTYSKIGGFKKIDNDPKAIRQYNYVYGQDWDKDKDLDVVIFGEKLPTNQIKSSGVGHDGQDYSKKLFISNLIKNIKSGKNITVASHAVAYILFKNNCPVVRSQKDVEKILNKKVEWIGKNPDGKFPQYDSWFKVIIAGEIKTKIMFGIIN